MLKTGAFEKPLDTCDLVCGIRVFNNWFMLTECNLVEIDKETNLYVFSLPQDAIDASWLGYLIQESTSSKLEFNNIVFVKPAKRVDQPNAVVVFKQPNESYMTRCRILQMVNHRSTGSNSPSVSQDSEFK